MWPDSLIEQLIVLRDPHDRLAVDGSLLLCRCERRRHGR